ncbi:hypothetical protein FB451DRAFT_1178565 [Mycena latifolia]|nr:hypothetical protein FB451DRAFT_1178565 [Mycena latifolia]
MAARFLPHLEVEIASFNQIKLLKVLAEQPAGYGRHVTPADHYQTALLSMPHLPEPRRGSLHALRSMRRHPFLRPRAAIVYSWVVTGRELDISNVMVTVMGVGEHSLPSQVTVLTPERSSYRLHDLVPCDERVRRFAGHFIGKLMISFKPNPNDRYWLGRTAWTVTLQPADCLVPGAGAGAVATRLDAARMAGEMRQLAKMARSSLVLSSSDKESGLSSVPNRGCKTLNVDRTDFNLGPNLTEIFDWSSTIGKTLSTGETLQNLNAAKKQRDGSTSYVLTNAFSVSVGEPICTITASVNLVPPSRLSILHMPYCERYPMRGPSQRGLAHSGKGLIRSRPSDLRGPSEAI